VLLSERSVHMVDVMDTVALTGLQTVAVKDVGDQGACGAMQQITSKPGAAHLPEECCKLNRRLHLRPLALNAAASSATLQCLQQSLCMVNTLVRWAGILSLTLCNLLVLAPERAPARRLGPKPVSAMRAPRPNPLQAPFRSTKYNNPFLDVARMLCELTR
jgi:hypothetical protein